MDMCPLGITVVETEREWEVRKYDICVFRSNRERDIKAFLYAVNLGYDLAQEQEGW